MPISAALDGFHDAFAAALLDPATGADGPLGALTGQPGFAVYRNTVLKGCIDALQANYPAIARLVGEEWFRAAAAVYARAQPPRLPMLAEYGASFAEFLESFEPGLVYPYLPDVARLDRLWTEAHAAADAPVLTANVLANLGAKDLATARLVPHPAARWQWFPHMPIYTIWTRNRAMPDETGEIEWSAEGVLMARDADGGVAWSGISRGGCVFLDQCRCGATIANAMESAVDAEANLNLISLMTTLFASGALSDMQLARSPSPSLHQP